MAAFSRYNRRKHATVTAIEWDGLDGTLTLINSLSPGSTRNGDAVEVPSPGSPAIAGLGDYVVWLDSEVKACQPDVFHFLFSLRAEVQ